MYATALALTLLGLGWLVHEFATARPMPEPPMPKWEAREKGQPRGDVDVPFVEAHFHLWEMEMQR